MTTLSNQNGTVLVFITLMIVRLLIMVGMGLDTGHLAYVRSQGQPAVDAATLAAASAIPTGLPSKVYARVQQLNYDSGTNAGGNNYLDSPNNLIDADLDSPNNLIDADNVTLINYDAARDPQIQPAAGTSSTSVGDANGVRVALESTNPYGGNPGTSMKSPLFLTPLLKLFGYTASATQNVSVSAVAVIKGFPVCRLRLPDASPRAPAAPARVRRTIPNKL
jgi:hypothetical protein